MSKLSLLRESIPPSATSAVNDKARAMQAAGLDIVVQGGGDLDFDTPTHIAWAGIAATPGITFDSSTEKHVCFFIASARSDLENVVDRFIEIAPNL